MLSKTKRRGRKCSNKKSSVVYNTMDNIVKSDLLGVDFDKYVIIQLNVKKEDIDKELYPEPYAPDMIDFALIEKSEEKIDNNTKIKENKDTDIEYSENVSEVNNGYFIIKKNIINIMFEYIDSNKKNKWPEKVSIYCTWCCFPFDTPPCGIPVKYIKEKFYLKDNFCSFNCAAAQIFSNKDDDMWEQYSLLNLLFKKMYNKDYVHIKEAPNKKMLKNYGGNWEIEHFRKNILTNSNMYNFVMPPMIALIPKLEEDIVDHNRKYDNNFIPVDEDAIKEAETMLRLKREKPIIDKGRTLQAFINIKSC